MLYLSQLLGAPVEDLQRARVGKVIDVLTPAAQVGQSEVSYLSALLIEGEEEHSWRVPLASLEQQDHLIRLRMPTEQLQRLSVASVQQEVYLAQEVLDKQVIDVEHKKAVRVNDVCFADDWRILGIDNSALGLVRRLAPSWLLSGKSKRDRK